MRLYVTWLDRLRAGTSFAANGRHEEGTVADERNPDRDNVDEELIGQSGDDDEFEDDELEDDSEAEEEEEDLDRK